MNTAELALIEELERYDWPEAANMFRTLINHKMQYETVVRWQTGRMGAGFEPIHRMHPLTCGNDSSHAPLFPLIDKDGVLTLVCADCDYRQTNVPEALFMAHDKTLEADAKNGEEDGG